MPDNEAVIDLKPLNELVDDVKPHNLGKSVSLITDRLNTVTLAANTLIPVGISRAMYVTDEVIQTPYNPS